jgi:hypothetical protein
MREHAMVLAIVFSAALLAGPPASGWAQLAEAAWREFYNDGFTLAPSGAWIGNYTKSEKAPDGLRILDPSTEPDSGRLYWFDWQVKPAEGATVEARLRVDASSEPWGCCVNVADGVNEEDVSFLPDRVLLSYANVSAPFPASDGFHTYRITFRAPDIMVWADDQLLIDGKGKFTAPTLVPNRNRVAFGASASSATSDSTWQYVRFQGGEAIAASQAVPIPDIPGLKVTRGDTITIVPDARYVSMFRFADGTLQVGGRRSKDGGKTWLDAFGPWVGAFQFPDGEVIQLDYRTHAGEEPGWYVSDLARWSADGEPLPTLKARLHVPDFVPMVDDDGSVRDGPWCDHAIIQLRDGSLLAACSGNFAADTTPITSYPTRFGAKKYRGWVCRSTDRGLTWEYYATVTADPDLGSEGCNEMDLIRAPNGDLLCVFRTGGSASDPSPLYQCRSTDEGKTWSPPQQVADRGVWPNMCLVSGDVLVCTYGRPDNWLTFSLDSGKTWIGHFCFDQGPSTCYNCVEQVAPGVILVTYDSRAYDDGGNATSVLLGTFFTVERQ